MSSCVVVEYMVFGILLVLESWDEDEGVESRQ